MGNRAVVTFDEKPNPNSIGIYLHWNGGAESVLAFLEAADRLDVRDNNDASYQLARVVQIIGNYFGGTTSVGVGRLRELDCDNGDNGTFAVSRNKGTTTIKHSRDGKTGWKDLDLAEIKKHDYWKGDQLLNEVLKANAKAIGQPEPDTVAA